MADQSKRLTQTELNALIGRYVVENMRPLSTVGSDSFRALIAKIPSRGGTVPPCRKTYSKYIEVHMLKYICLTIMGNHFLEILLSKVHNKLAESCI